MFTETDTLLKIFKFLTLYICVLIEFALPNLSLIYIFRSEIIKTINNSLEFKPGLSQ